MLPRRITEHVKAQNWFAFAIDNWNEARAAKAAAELPDQELKRGRVRRLADLDTKRINSTRIIDRIEALDRFLAEAET